jgi:hypothetical protein
MAGLKKKFPETILEDGFRGDTIIARLNAPVIEGEEQIFTDTANIKLKHYIKGVVMRYTLDGSDPDSVQSPVYKDVIQIDKPGLLKVKAYLPGWESSSIVTRNFYKTGFIPDSVRLVTNPSPTYQGSGGKTLADGQKGELNFRDGKWLGYMDNDMQAYFYFNAPVHISDVSFSTIVDIGSYIMPAYELEVWGGKTSSDLKLLKKIKPKQPTALAPPYLIGFDCVFVPQTVGVLKVVAKPVPKLPSWHPGKGQRGWVFVDEIFIN